MATCCTKWSTARSWSTAESWSTARSWSCRRWGPTQPGSLRLLILPLGTFVKTQGLGRAVVEMLFRIDPAPNLQRRPDLAFVSYERWPRGKRVPEDAAWDVVPELAIEVVSPTNLAEDLLAKVHDISTRGPDRSGSSIPPRPRCTSMSRRRISACWGAATSSTAGPCSPASGSPWRSCSKTRPSPPDAQARLRRIELALTSSACDGTLETARGRRAWPNLRRDCACRRPPMPSRSPMRSRPSPRWRRRPAGSASRSAR